MWQMRIVREISKGFMHAIHLTERIDYDGSQLRSHWILERTGKIGDAIVAFQGAADVGAAHMVDLEDKMAKAWIHSDLMLHFIVEHFGATLDLMICKQRLLVAIIGEEIGAAASAHLVRCGNDLFNGDAKLSVSIATVSPVSGLIHTGVNVNSENTPVLTKGLADYHIEAGQFAQKVMERYCEEMEGIEKARAKVLPVS